MVKESDGIIGLVMRALCSNPPLSQSQNRS